MPCYCPVTYVSVKQNPSPAWLLGHRFGGNQPRYHSHQELNRTQVLHSFSTADLGEINRDIILTKS